MEWKDRRLRDEDGHIPGVSNRTQSNTNRSIGFGNQTKSNIYFAVSSIIEPIEQNRTQSDKTHRNNNKNVRCRSSVIERSIE